MPEALSDANLVLRLLTNDPRPLADRASALIDAAERRRVTLVVAALTVAEVVYVLSRVYHWERPEIARVLLELLAVPTLAVLDREAVVQALIWYRDVPAVHFADAYIAALAVERGHGNVISFDRELRHLPGIRLIDDAAELPGS